MANNTSFDWFEYYEGFINQSGGREVPEDFNPREEGFELWDEVSDIEELKADSYEGYEPDWWYTIKVFRRGSIFVARMWHETKYTASYNPEYEGGAIWIDLEI